MQIIPCQITPASEAALATGPWDAELRERERRRENGGHTSVPTQLLEQPGPSSRQSIFSTEGMDALT